MAFGISSTNLMYEVAKLITEHMKNSHFIAEVVGTSGNKISIKRVGTDTTEGPYAAASGLAAAVSPGDVVKVERQGNAYHVAYKIVS